MSEDLRKGHSEVNKLINSVINNDFSYFDKNKEISNYANYLIKKRNAEETFQYMINSFMKNELNKAIKHAKKLERMTTTHANDFPFEVGDEISVIRHRHGWHDGGLHGKVISRNNCAGIWTYDVETDDYGIVELEHTRDAFLI